jgi:hypothetical protein
MLGASLVFLKNIYMGTMGYGSPRIKVDLVMCLKDDSSILFIVKVHSVCDEVLLFLLFGHEAPWIIAIEQTFFVF